MHPTGHDSGLTDHARRGPAVQSGVSSAAAAYQPQLDGIRAFAVLCVVAFHARGSWFPGGYIGVDVFFVLSGFLITRILVREYGRSGRIALRSFYARRALRLFPALVVMCSVTAVVFWLAPTLPERSETLVGLLGAITYSSSWLIALGISDLGFAVPTWSLAVEEYFYLVWPLLLIVMLRARRHFGLMAVGSALLGIGYMLIAYCLLGWSVPRIHYAADTRAYQLLIGCALAVVLPAMSKRVTAGWALLATILLMAFVLGADRVPFDIYHSGGSVVIALLAATVIAFAASSESGRFIELLERRPLVWVGQRSYGIYLWNLPIIAIFGFLGSGGFLSVGFKLLLSFFIPALSYRFVEQPFLRLKDRFHSG